VHKEQEELEKAAAVKVKFKKENKMTGGEDAKMNAERNAMHAEMNEKEVDATAAVKVKMKPKGKVLEAGTAEVKVSGSTGMNKSYPWARMTPLLRFQSTAEETNRERSERT
jgi:hypothetical protein